MVPHRQNWPYSTRMERIFVVCALLFCAGAFIPLLSNQTKATSEDKPRNATVALIQKQSSSTSSDPTRANPVVLVCQILVFGITAGLLLRHRHHAWLYLRNTKIVWVVVALAFLSILWSDQPGFAFRRCLNMTATCGLGLYLATRYSQRELLRLLGWALTISIVGSVLFALLWPDLGVDSALVDYGWKGVFVHKNTLGRLMSLGVLVFLFLASDSKPHRRAYIFACVACGIMIFASHSATSAMAVPIAIALIWLFSLSRQRSAFQVFIFAISAAVGIMSCLMLFIDPADLFAFLGRDATMSGRTEIWSAVLPKIMVHPWLGYGYSSFWLGMEGQASADLWSILGWSVPHSHNGFLDLVEELGIVGLCLFLAGLIVSFRRGLLWARTRAETIALWPLAYISFMILFNLTESSILRQDNLFWVLYVATSVSIIYQTNHFASESPVDEVGTKTLIGTRYVPQGAAKTSMGLRWS